ncbi:low affinity immunoglobulin epsilon Fc receptor-like [Pomacea canaliculata]|uniref:low affinity immunoglobulin epsilon Fc receptor-like n=1 Tax=Pomacea canaliculata TaxID=400727 RepID=UPI000D726A8E|nr:low affinity immunoglobulin epsilon Fc receptor-like [Pomacea canaliculata]
MREQVVVIILLLAASGLCEKQCPPSWTQLEHSCYVLLEELLTWIEAREFCLAVGGHLAEIENVNENRFLTAILVAHSVNGSWIGLEDLTQEDRFVWTTSQREAVYTNWARDEPSDSQRAQNCVWLTNKPEWQPPGGWDDGQCGAHFLAMCEQPLH